MDSPAYPTPAERKRALRAEARVRRASTDPSRREREAAGWARQVRRLAREHAATVVAVYASYGTEPPTARVVDDLHDTVGRIIEPVMLPDRDLDWVLRIDPDTPLG